MSNGPLAILNSLISCPDLKIKDVWVDSYWDVQLFESLVGCNKANEIIAAVSRGLVGKDVVIWKPSHDGHFSSASALELDRLKGAKLEGKIQRAGVVSTLDGAIVKELGVSIFSNFRRQPMMISWTQPRASWFKLNVDGACRGNLGSCGGGGVVRNDRGKLVAAFLAKFTHGTNNEVELRALIHGLLLCRDLDIRKLEIECDSMLVVQALENFSYTVWYLWDFWDELIELIQYFDYIIAHQFRE
ncbi:uncharacterized protein LOC118349649 [Juglans regia]|uniref:Uncharacterized protein LOC118349649 n=1 Tax=Juglans regia TaxID=51240 RepID=A0A6P9EUZ6_JUGRE|nr:uncharacterized protein LOC118349649 [Juglans regia]